MYNPTITEIIRQSHYRAKKDPVNHDFLVDVLNHEFLGNKDIEYYRDYFKEIICKSPEKTIIMKNELMDHFLENYLVPNQYASTFLPKSLLFTNKDINCEYHIYLYDGRIVYYNDSPGEHEFIVFTT